VTRYEGPTLSLENLVNLPCITSLSALSGLTLWVLKTANKPVRFDVNITSTSKTAEHIAKEAALLDLVLPFFLNKSACGHSTRQAQSPEKLDKTPERPCAVRLFRKDSTLG